MPIGPILTDSTTRALELSASFAEARHRVLAENLANVDTPGYTTQVLDPQAFQTSLQEALARGDSARNDRLELRGNSQVATDAAGRIAVRPISEPAQNVLFHDGTNAGLEKLVTDINGNALQYDLATNLLRARYQSLLNAIRGRT